MTVHTPSLSRVIGTPGARARMLSTRKTSFAFGAVTEYVTVRSAFTLTAGSCWACASTAPQEIRIHNGQNDMPSLLRSESAPAARATSTEIGGPRPPCPLMPAREECSESRVTTDAMTR